MYMYHICHHSNLIGVFERAGYQGYTEVVCGKYHHHKVKITPTGDTPTNQPVCGQECATAISSDETSTGVMDSGCPMEKGRSCDQSHDSSDSENEVFSTPPTSSVPPQHDSKSQHMFTVN